MEFIFFFMVLSFIAKISVCISEEDYLPNDSLEESNASQPPKAENFITEIATAIEQHLNQQENRFNTLALETSAKLIRIQEQNSMTWDILCHMKEALMFLLKINGGTSAEDIVTHLQSTEACNKRNVVSVREEYCQLDPLLENETVRTYSINITGQGICTNINPVPGINKCVGLCSSMTKFSHQDGEQGYFSSRCTCCKPAKFEKVRVSLICESGVSFSRNFDNIVACQCLDCQEEAP